MVNIGKKDIVELKSLANPPVVVKQTLEIVMILFNEKTAQWRDIQKAMANPEAFCRQIQSIGANSVSDKNLRKAKEGLKELTPE